MQHDKKARSGRVRMVLPVTMGAAAMFDDITPDTIEQAIEALRTEKPTNHKGRKGNA